MIKLVDLNYYTHSTICNPEEVIKLQKASVGFVDFIKDRLCIWFIMHMNYEGEKCVNSVKYRFFKSRNKFWHIPFKTHSYVQTQDPDIVLIQGLIFPLQVIALRLKLGRKARLIVQHHGERPFSGIKRICQHIADRCITNYLFTSVGNADEWIKRKIISRQKCMELLEASTDFRQQNRIQCKSVLSFTGNLNFLWVGRLNSGKDPMTVLKAFEKYLTTQKNARLFMVFQTRELLPEIKRRLDKNTLLKSAVILQGEVPHVELETWYNAADFYISGSHKEGSGYALIEAMACGCIPIVTSIPSFKKITGNGTFGILFEPGDSNDLLNCLSNLENIEKSSLRNSINGHFTNSLSFKSIADTLFRICEKVASR